MRNNPWADFVLFWHCLVCDQAKGASWMTRYIISACLWMVCATAAAAETSSWDRLQSQVTSQLELQGYSKIEVTRTWLGRMYIEAHNGDHERQIVINPLTGELLRDYWYSDTSAQNGNPFAHFERNDDRKKSRKKSKRDHDDDDDHDDHDDDDEDDD